MAWAAVAGAATAVVGGALLNKGSGNVSQQASAADAAQADAIRQQTSIAGDMWNRYKEVYEPMQDKVIADASTIDSPERQEQAAGVAHADVTGAMLRQRQAGVERLRAMGVNPSSEKFINANMRLAGTEAGLDAAAQNTAREGVKTVGRNMRASIAAGGNGVAGSAGNMYGTAASQAGSAATRFTNQQAQNMQRMGSFLQPVSGAVSDWVKGGGFGSTGFGSGVNSVLSGGTYAQQGMGFGEDGRGAYDNELSYEGPSGGSGVQLAQGDYSGGYYADGGVVRYADGGKVDGPGTGTSDSVAVAVRGKGGVARGYISDGEFVVPADVVKAKGTEFFNKLIETYHTPVRRGVRR
jgi:hypothetical protein